MDPLEYDEESEGDDLFGSDDETALPPTFAVDERVPIGRTKVSQNKKARLPSPPVPTSPPPIKSLKDTQLTPDQRMNQLRNSRAMIPPPPPLGVPSLKVLTLAVIRRNAGRIYDIGGLQYAVLAEFIDHCGREQLTEIEENSPHIVKDTDWLWEAFVLEEYPIYYGQCRLRKGQPRTSGWRRMYEKAAADAAERRQMAMERVAERYRKLEEERASKKIVVMDMLVAPKQPRSRGSSGHSLSSTRRGAAAAAPYSATTKAQNAFNKARNESQRARVALTHASGKFVPPVNEPKRARSAGETKLYSNPYNAQASASTPGPRIPRPRVPRPAGLLPDAYPTATESEKGSEAPGSSTPHKVAPASGRFRIDLDKRAPKPIYRPQVENFEAPKPTRQVLDFFSTSSPMASAAIASPSKRASPSNATTDVKRQKLDATPMSSRGGSPQELPSNRASPMPSSQSQSSSSAGPPRQPPARQRPEKGSESSLFMKKKRKLPVKP